MENESVSLKDHFNKVIELNDRRYTEVNIEKEKALKIKETADLAALELARQIQTYKDEKANELREQIASERGLYVTNEKFDTVVAPITAYINSQTGRNGGLSAGWGFLLGLAGLVLTVLAIGSRFIAQ